MPQSTILAVRKFYDGILIHANADPSWDRLKDVLFSPNKPNEMKFGDDSSTLDQVSKDIYLFRYGGTIARSGTSVDSFNTQYQFVPDPVTGAHTSQNNLNILDTLGIPYEVWGAEFWNRLRPQ